MTLYDVWGLLIIATGFLISWKQEYNTERRVYCGIIML